MSVALGPFFWFGRYEWIACNSYGQRGEVQWSEKYLSINTKFFQISRILGIFRLAIFILQLTNSSGASAGNSWGQRGVVQWTVQRSRTFFKAAIASNTWCTPFYEYWRRNISFIFYSRWYLAATAVIMTFTFGQECCLLMLSLNRTRHEKIILLFLNKTGHEKIILLFHESWVFSHITSMRINVPELVPERSQIWLILRCWGNSSILCQQNSDAL